MLVVQTACMQSRSLMVYLANTNQPSFVVPVNWHAHYAVNIELICSTLHHVSMFLCLIFRAFVFELFYYCYQLSGE